MHFTGICRFQHAHSLLYSGIANLSFSTTVLKMQTKTSQYCLCHCHFFILSCYYAFKQFEAGSHCLKHKSDLNKLILAKEYRGNQRCEGRWPGFQTA